MVNRLGGLSLRLKSVIRLTDRPDMTLDVYRGRKTTQQQQHSCFTLRSTSSGFRKKEITICCLLKLVIIAFHNKNGC